MKKALLSLLLLSFCVASVDAQQTKRKRHRAKQKKGNHRNEPRHAKINTPNTVSYHTIA